MRDRQGTGEGLVRDRRGTSEGEVSNIILQHYQLKNQVEKNHPSFN